MAHHHEPLYPGGVPLEQKSRNPEIQKSRKPEIKKSRNPEIQKSRNPEIQKSRNPEIQKSVRDSGQHCRGSEDHDTTKYSLSGYWLRPCRSLQDQFTKWLLTILPLPREGVLERVQGPAHPHYMRGLSRLVEATSTTRPWGATVASPTPSP